MWSIINKSENPNYTKSQELICLLSPIYNPILPCRTGFDWSFCSASWAPPVQPLVIIKVGSFVLQVQPAGLSLPECRHHAKPTFWCESLFQRSLLQVNWMFVCFLTLNCASIMLLYPSIVSGALIAATSSRCLPPAEVASWRRRTGSLPTACRKYSWPTFLVTFCSWVTLNHVKFCLMQILKKCIPQLYAWLSKYSCPIISQPRSTLTINEMFQPGNCWGQSSKDIRGFELDLKTITVWLTIILTNLPFWGSDGHYVHTKLLSKLLPFSFTSLQQSNKRGVGGRIWCSFITETWMNGSINFGSLRSDPDQRTGTSPVPRRPHLPVDLDLLQ